MENKIPEEQQTPIIPVIINWMDADKNPPPEINTEDKYDLEDKVSKTVLTISDYGTRWARFYHRSGNWQFDGVHSGKKLKPKYWAYLTLPDEKPEVSPRIFTENDVYENITEFVRLFATYDYPNMTKEESLKDIKSLWKHMIVSEVKPEEIPDWNQFNHNLKPNNPI